MPQLPSWFVLTLLVFVLALALWLFSNAREDAYSDINTCNFDDPRERLKELEAAFAAGMMTAEEFQKLSEKLGGEIARPVTGNVSSRQLPKTWDDLKNRKRSAESIGGLITDTFAQGKARVRLHIS